MKTIITTIISVAIATLIHAQGTIAIYGPTSGIATNAMFTNTSSFYSQNTGTYTRGKTFSGNTAPSAYLYALLIATSTTAGD